LFKAQRKADKFGRSLYFRLNIVFFLVLGIWEEKFRSPLNGQKLGSKFRSDSSRWSEIYEKI